MEEAQNSQLAKWPIDLLSSIDGAILETEHYNGST